MATGQVALARHRTPTITMQKPRSQVPAFLQKLHEMVNDPNNHELIRWSDAGDSFYVLDHERFSREVLGRWFKHQNFASFVRQLNMYGFHKIPHLQQGVLKSDTDTEFWNFAHPNFVRGQPDLLCLIQRKKQVPQGAAGAEGVVDGVLDLQRAESSSTGGAVAGATTSANASATSPSANNQVMDVPTILQGITVIKRHQAAISQELNELKQSNQLLWQDAMEARQRHQKQQDTINRIVKFLAGVFGSRAGSGMGHHKDVDGNLDAMSSGAMVPRRVSRFLIEDGASGQSGGKVRVDVDDDMDGDRIFSIPEYPIVETPTSVPSPAPSDTSLPPTVMQSTPTTEHAPQHDPLPPNPPKPPFTVSTGSAPPYTLSSAISSSSSSSPKNKEIVDAKPSQPQPRVPQQQPKPDQIADRSITPSRSPSNLDFDPRVQTFLNQLSPAQIQQLLSNLSTMEPISTNEHNGPDASLNPHQVMQYSHPPLDWSQFIANAPSFQSVSGGIDSLLSFDDHPSSSVPAPASDLSQHNDPQSRRIVRDWKAAEDIDRDVNAINTDLESFIRDLGLDPSTIDSRALGGLGDDRIADDGMNDDGHTMDTSGGPSQPRGSSGQNKTHRSTGSGSSATGNLSSSSSAAAAATARAASPDPANLFDIGSLLSGWDQLESTSTGAGAMSGVYAPQSPAEAFANSGLDSVQHQGAATVGGSHSRNSSTSTVGFKPPNTAAAGPGGGVGGYEGNKRKSLDLSDRESVSGLSVNQGVQESPTTKGTKRRKKAT